jgi:uncharacterized protein YecE (DUF72 family)
MRDELKAGTAELARQGIYLGTSSWKYEGWCGQIYGEQRYLTRKKWSQARFERDCLEEYAEVFPSVCIDAGYYKFPTAQYIADLAAQVPAGFTFSFKVTDTITLKHFPNLPRHGSFAGQQNEHFLSAKMFANSFIEPMKPFREKIGLLIFEFSQFQKRDFDHGRDFVSMLDHFLDVVPKGWDYGVELRNKTWLQPDYFNCLRAHGVAHVFNNWSRMPSIAEQIKIEDAFTADHVGARFLLTPPFSYEDSVTKFQPYSEIREPNPEATRAGSDLIERMLKKTRRGYIYVNNRLEGNAPKTLLTMLKGVRR